MHRFSAVLLVSILALAVPARAADDPFTVKDVGVDATAASATEAQNIAINSGRPKAWSILFHRLVRQQDWAKQPALDELSLQRLIRSYVVNDERRSTTRYVAKVTYVFNADAVRRLFRSNNLAYVDTTSKPLLVIGLSPKYNPHGGWSALFANRNAGGVNLVVPSGGGLDNQILEKIDFGTVTWPALAPVATRVGASEAYLALASAGGGKITVKLRRVGPGISPPIPDLLVNVAPGTSGPKAYSDAAAAAAAAIADSWKTRSAVDFSQRSKLLIEVRIDSAEQYGSILGALATVSLVTDVGVVAMNMGEARLQLVYAGTLDQLHDALAQAHLDLAQRGGLWWLAKSETVTGTP